MTDAIPAAGQDMVQQTQVVVKAHGGPWRCLSEQDSVAVSFWPHESRLSAAASHVANSLSFFLGNANPSSEAPTRTTRQAWSSIVQGPRPRPVMRTNG